MQPETKKFSTSIQLRGRVVSFPRSPQQIAAAKRQLLLRKKERALWVLRIGIALLAIPTGFLLAALTRSEAGSFPFAAFLLALSFGSAALGSRLLSRALRERRDIGRRLALLVEDTHRREHRVMPRRLLISRHNSADFRA